MTAKQATSFFINIIKHVWNPLTVQTYTLDNEKTNEKLVVEQDSRRVKISRYPVGANEEWIKEMAKYEDTYEYRIITIDF